MDIRRILLTGDDGYNSIGTRTLAHFLKPDFDIYIVGTLDQQSGVGGKMTLSGGAWGETMVDGVNAIWVNAGPVDAMEVAQAYFDTPFDLILSGINFGANVGGSLNSSGTFAAAFRALNIGISPRAMTLSWNKWVKHSLENHTGAEDLNEYIDYPGRVAYAVIREALRQDMWGSKFLNINFPEEQSNRVRFTKPLADVREFYYYPLDLDKENHHFSYPAKVNTQANRDIVNDTGAILEGYISITPCQSSMVNESIYQTLKDKAFSV